MKSKNQPRLLLFTLLMIILALLLAIWCHFLPLTAAGAGGEAAWTLPAAAWIGCREQEAIL